MTTTTDKRETMIAHIAAKIREANEEWEQGRMTSPSELDYVIDARNVLAKRDPDFIGTTPEGEEELAGCLFDDAGETYQTEEQIATFLYDELTRA